MPKSIMMQNRTMGTMKTNFSKTLMIFSKTMKTWMKVTRKVLPPSGSCSSTLVFISSPVFLFVGFSCEEHKNYQRVHFTNICLHHVYMLQLFYLHYFFQFFFLVVIYLICLRSKEFLLSAMHCNTLCYQYKDIHHHQHKPSQ